MLVYFAVSLTMLLGFCGLAVDVGRMELRKTQLQAAADGAALSVAAEYQRGNASWASVATTEASASATANGYPNPTVAVQQFASSGAYAADNSTFQVTLTQTMSTTFLKLLGKSSASISARGVAMVPPCLFLMGNPTVSGTGYDLWLASSAFNGLTCPVYAKHGYLVDGFASICCTTPKTTGPPSASAMYGSTYPAIQYNSPNIADPLAYVAAPAFNHCDSINQVYLVPTTISAGTYCGGLRVVNTTLTMLPGLYIITGGVVFNNATVNGAGVTLFLTHGGGSGFGTFAADYSTLNLSAPTTGQTAAITIFGDRNWVGGNQDFRFNFSPLYGDGIVYTTGTGVYNWTSRMWAPDYFTIVTANLYAYNPYNSKITPSANYSLLPGGDPLHLPIALVQ